MTALYQKHGLNFAFPENWRLTENQQPGEFVVVELESPTGCIWSASLFPHDADPAHLLRISAAALGEQYEDLEVTDFHGQLESFEATGFDADFYCLDFLVTARTRMFLTPDNVVLIFCQAENRELEQFQDVFDAITLSLLRGCQ